MAINDVYSTDVYFNYQGQVNNVYNWHLLTVNDANTGTNEKAINTYFQTTVLPAYAVMLMETFVFTCIETKRVLDNSVKEPISSIGEQLTVNIPGEVGSPETALPGQCSMVIQLLSDLESSKPEDRGRDFYTGFPCSTQVDGVFEATAMNAVTAMISNAFPQGFVISDGGTWGWVTWSGKKLAERLAQEQGPWSPPTSDVTWLRPLKHVRTQRRRQSENPCDRYGDVLDLGE